MRYFIQFSYFGKPYHGWQAQPNAITVQQVLEEVLSTLLKGPIALMGAGRTDTGVHAKQMFAHFDAGSIENFTDLAYRLNSFLPDDIAVHRIFKVPHDAHARFDAVERTYEYWISQEKNPFLTDTAYFIKYPLDIEKMNQAAELLLQYNDFECFSKSHTDVKTYQCAIKKAVWEKKEGKLIFTITADRFLRNMVRAIVGTLLDVGQGKCSIDDVKTILKSKDRVNAGPSVPAKGLYLITVSYHNSIIKTHG